VIWVRLSVLALVLMAATAAILVAGDRGPGKPVATKYGVTSQGRAFEVQVDGGGQPVAIATELAAMCPSGRMVSMPWAPVEGDGIPFHRAGGKLRVAERGDTYELALDATVASNGAVKGTMTLVVHVRPETRAPYDCASPRVRVSAGR
jgi:hypothetical protein